MMFDRIFARARRGDGADALYAAIVRSARTPAFYTDLGVPDTFDGRFDMVLLHTILVLSRLGAERGAGEPEARMLAQGVFDLLFADLDRSLREVGVGDLGVGRRIKDMAQAFYGRAAAYEAALGEPCPALEQAIARNLYRGRPPSEPGLMRITNYVRETADIMARTPLEALSTGRIRCAAVAGGPPPT